MTRRAPPNHAWLGGRLVPFSEATVPIDDRGLVFAESLYEVAPVTKGRVRLLPEHVLRMQRAAPALGLESGVPSLEEWERFTSELLRRDPVDEGLLYAQLTGGAAPREYVPAVAPAPTFFAHVSAFRFPRETEVEQGARAVVLGDLRWARRDLKTTMLLPGVLAKKEAKRQGADEALLVGADGLVHEGASSNVFIVEAGAIVTPEQSPKLLPGTMRPVVMEAAKDAGFSVRSEGLSVERLRSADEVFITSSSQLVMPVVSIDGVNVGSGSAGSIARDLARRLRARFELEECPALV